MIDLNLVKKDILDIIIKSEVFNPQDISWITTILYRLDGKNGVEQIRPLALLCEKYQIEKPKLTPFQCYMIELEITHALNVAKSLYSKQRSILIGVPQRKKHPKFNVPNLFGLVTPQNLKVEIDTCYGLGYCESRHYFVEKALQKNRDYTHIFFIDDDILIPLNALTTMINLYEPIVGANYMKRNVLNETVCTTVTQDPEFIYTNNLVESNKDDMKPVPVSGMGLGCVLVDINVFKKLSPPYFQFVHDTFENGMKRNLILGEDTFFIHKALTAGFTPKVIPGLVPIHTDLKTGNQFGPDWLVDPVTKKIRPEHEEHYCKFACKTQELYHPDIDTIFNQPTRI